MEVNMRSFILSFSFVTWSASQLIATEVPAQRILSCTETATFSDGPGNTYLVSISHTSRQAIVLSKPVTIRGGTKAEWRINHVGAEVSSISSGGVRIMGKSEAPATWNAEEPCFPISAEY